MKYIAECYDLFSDVGGGVLRYSDNLQTDSRLFTGSRPSHGGSGSSSGGTHHPGEPLNLHKLSSTSPGVTGGPQQRPLERDRAHERPSDRQVKRPLLVVVVVESQEIMCTVSEITGNGHSMIKLAIDWM